MASGVLAALVGLYVWLYETLMTLELGGVAIVLFGVAFFASGTMAFGFLHNWSLVVVNALYRRAMDEQLIIEQGYIHQLYSTPDGDTSGIPAARWAAPVPWASVPRGPSDDAIPVALEGTPDEPWDGVAHLRWAAHRASWHRLHQAWAREGARGDGQATSLEDARRVLGPPLLMGRPCADCGNPHAPIHCAACGSVQWSDLATDRLAEAMPRWHYQGAAVVAKYRVQLLAGALSSLLAVVTGVAGSGFYDFSQRRAERVAQEGHDANEFVESAFGFRQALAEYEHVCDDGRAETDRGDHCAALFSSFQQHYYRFSWYGTPLLQRLRRQRCLDGGRRGHEVLACHHLDPDRVDLIDRVDDRFRDYIAAHKIDSPERRLAAVNLYYIGRLVSCVVGALAWYEEQAPFDNRSFDSCIGALEADDFQPHSQEDLPTCNSAGHERLRTWCVE